MHNRVTPKLVLRALFAFVLLLSTTPSIPAAQADVSSGSITFARNGADKQYLRILKPNNKSFEFAGNFTVEGWFKFTRFDLYQQFIGQATGVAPAWSLQMMPGANNQLRLTGNFGDINSTSDFIANRWYHIALVRSGMATNNMKIYVDGVATGEGTYNTASNSGLYGGIFGDEDQIYTVGAGTYDGSDRFDGSVSNIRYSTRAVYTGAFTPSTSPLTADADTVLLLNTTNDANYLRDSSSSNANVIARNHSSTTTGLPVTDASSPFLSISSTSETATVGTAINSYTLSNPNPSETYTASVVGGSAFSSPTNGISFNTTTGVFSGTPTAAAAAATYLVTGSTSKASATYALTVVSGQTITFGALTDKIISDTPPTLSATATSGLTVAFTSATSGVCTVSGTSVTFVGPGTCTINANQAGDASNAAAAQVQRSFAIAYLTQSISFDALTGATLGVSSAPLIKASASSGLGVAYSSITPGVCSVSGTTITMLNPGTCTISASQAGNGTYSAAATINQSFTITAKPDDGQKELLAILALIPSIGELALSLGETTQSLYKQKCVKGKLVKYVKSGAKCPKGYAVYKKKKVTGS
jgi:hypothetical protein